MRKKRGHLGVAQLGSAPPWGGGGRGFKSRRSDQAAPGGRPRIKLVIFKANRTRLKPPGYFYLL